MRRNLFVSKAVFAIALSAPFALGASVWTVPAAAQDATQTATQPAAKPHADHNPMTTGTPMGKMDAGVPEQGMEQYAHSSTVQAIARHLGISTNQAARYFEDFNSGVLILVILYFLIKMLPGKFRTRREAITRDLADARKQTSDAQGRLAGIEARLASLGTEVDALRKQAAASAEHEEARMQQSLQEEKERIVRAAQAEIHAAQATAERGLKRYASDLAVDRAAERVQLSPGDDQALIDEFLQGLAGELGKRGQN